MKKTILILGAFWLLAAGLHGQAPCFGDFRYSQSINVQNINPALSDFPIRLNVDTQTLIGAGKMASNGSDLRFGAPDCCTELNYWIQSGLGTANTTIWVLMDTIPAGSTLNVWMYYGNATASAVSNIDSVMLSIGNDDMGIDSSASGQTIGTTQYRFPTEAKTVRWRIFSGDSASFRLKVVDSTDLVKGFSPLFTTSQTAGFQTYDWEGSTTTNGYPAWFTADASFDIMNNCAPVTPCPGSCGDMQYTAGDVGINGNPVTTDSCGAYPSLRVWYRNFSNAFFDVTGVLQNDEVDRNAAIVATASQPNVCAVGSSTLVANYPGTANVGWFRNNVPVGSGDTLVVTSPGDYYFIADYNACNDLPSNTLNIVGSASTVDLGPDRTECVDSIYTLDAGPGFNSYLWSDGSTAQTLDIFVSGIFWVEATDSNGCVDMDTVIIQLAQTSQAVITPGPNVEICGGGSVVLDAFNQNVFIYEWLPGGETSADLEVIQSGSYQVVTTDANGCTDTSDVVNVNIYPSSQVNLGADTVLCETDSLVLMVSPIWDSVLWADSVSMDLSYTAFPPGDFWVEVTDTNGCKSRDTIRITTFSPLAVDLGADLSICPIDSLVLDVTTGGATSYLWNDGTTTPTNVVFGSPTSQSVQVTVTDTNNCAVASDPLLVSTYPDPPIPLISRMDDQLLTSVTMGSFQWFVNNDPIGGATSPSLVIPGPGSYYVEVTDVNNCQTLLSNVLAVSINIPKEIIPEGFSPNGDNLNDLFEVPLLENYPGNSLSILNRYGSEVFRQSPYQNGFDGTRNGRDLPDGTYFYILDLGIDEEPISGYLIIQR